MFEGHCWVRRYILWGFGLLLWLQIGLGGYGLEVQFPLYKKDNIYCFKLGLVVDRLDYVDIQLGRRTLGGEPLGFDVGGGSPKSQKGGGQRRQEAFPSSPSPSPLHYTGSDIVPPSPSVSFSSSLELRLPPLPDFPLNPSSI